MRSRPYFRSLVLVVLVLPACGDPDPVRPQAQAVGLAAISGDRQPARAGRQLSEPFVVHVTDRRGRGVEHVSVSWTVLAGEGMLDGDRGDRSFDCPPGSTANSWTDVDGFAQMSFMPTWFGPIAVTAEVTASEVPPVIFSVDASDPGAVVTIVAGNHQEGKAGTWLPEDLRVQVTDGQGDRVGHIEVTFAVTSGGGGLGGCSVPGRNPAWGITRTLPEGLMDGDHGFGSAGIPLALAVQGTTTVAAAVAGVPVPPVTFTATGHGAVVQLSPDPSDPWNDDVRFWGPDATPDVGVPVGAPVEWVNWNWFLATAQIVSTTAPEGGVSFDSGELDLNARFEFVPHVSGTWEFVDLATGSTGTLTAW